MSYTAALIDCIGSDPGHGRPALAYLMAYFMPATSTAGFLILFEDTATGVRFYRYPTSSAADAAREWLAVGGCALTVSACLRAADRARGHWRAVENSESLEAS